jgi:hypothetical protein
LRVIVIEQGCGDHRKAVVDLRSLPRNLMVVIGDASARDGNLRDRPVAGTDEKL